MAATFAPFGLRPINLIGGQAFTGSTRLIKIASGTAENLYCGQPVRVSADGVVVSDDLSSNDNKRPVGVFVGCTYTDPNLKYKIFRQSWPSGTVASDAYAYVVDDPDALFMVQADGQVAQSALGANIDADDTTANLPTAGSTVTGNSTMAVKAATVATTNSLPFRIVDFYIDAGNAVNDAYTMLIVKWNAGYHSYNNSTGV